jgi:ATP-binding cassette subfamily G (WHITE) protein 2 (SNQ2)
MVDPLWFFELLANSIQNCFTFYKIGNTSVDMQNRLFSIFMTLTISPPLIQQLQPKFLGFRQVFQARERASKIYSWVAFCVGAIAVEIPYSIVAGTIYMMCWWWGSVGWHRSGFDTGYTWLMLMLFELFYVGFGQAIAAFSPNDLLASLLVPVFFLFVVSFCGVVVPYQALPTFWRSWMYYLSPFTYLLEGFLGAATHGIQVECADKEYARFSPPPGTSCQDYTSAFIQQAGGYVREANGMCMFCQYATGDEFARSFNVYWDHRWRDYGIFWAFVLFNFCMVFVASYFYLGGLQNIKNKIGGKGTKGKGKKSKGKESPASNDGAREEKV